MLQGNVSLGIEESVDSTLMAVGMAVVRTLDWRGGEAVRVGAFGSELIGLQCSQEPLFPSLARRTHRRAPVLRQGVLPEEHSAQTVAPTTRGSGHLETSHFDDTRDGSNAQYRMEPGATHGIAFLQDAGSRTCLVQPRDANLHGGHRSLHAWHFPPRR